MENEMLIPVILAGVFTAMAVVGVATKKGFYARPDTFLRHGDVFNLRLAAGEGGMAEIMSIACSHVKLSSCTLGSLKK